MEKNTNPSIWGRVIFFVFLAVVLTAFYFFSRPDTVVEPENQEETVNKIGGQIALVEGAVEYKSADGEWKRANIGLALSEGDSMEVVGDGRAILNLDDGSAIRLNANSGITLSSLNSTNFVILNDKGQVYTRVAELNNRSFEVMVENISYQSVGTAYKTVNTENKKGVEVYDSKVKVLGSDEKEVLVEAGSKYYSVNAEDKNAENRVAKITTSDNNDAFVKWNLNLDKSLITDEENNTDNKTETSVKTTKPVETVKTPVVSGAVNSISLKSTGGASISWVINGYSSQGYKVVWSKNAHPTYPTRSGDKYLYYTNPDQKNSSLEAFSGSGSYYVRVCEYLGGKCGVYSNEIKVQLAVTDQRVSNISLSYLGEGMVKWNTTGESSQGFKLVWSKKTGPTYPLRTGDTYLYFTDPKQSTASVSAFDGSGVYFVRVCEYLGGTCGVYSNEIQISL